MSTLNDLLATILDRGARLVDRSGGRGDDPAALCADLLTSRGEASGVAIASDVFAAFDRLDADDRVAFFHALAEDFDIDVDAADAALADYRASKSADALAALIAATEPKRQMVFRRLNAAPGGTRRLVAMRKRLLPLLKTTPALRKVDDDLRHLLGSWFNRGFLVLRAIDWRTSAELLEKIIAYEAVHEIDSWEDLRRRLQPQDRRCFGFFHPALPDEPLIFVEVALTCGISESIQEVLREDREILAPDQADTAVFYSISNCQDGLKGVSFGAFLIKQVAADLARDHPNLKTFATLSPVPGFTRWLRRAAEADADGPAAEAADALAVEGWSDDAAALEGPITALAAQYFLVERRADGEPIDPVARFHLGNGASLHRINWMADRSAKGLAQSAGVMVNYRYALDAIEANHEAYEKHRKINASSAVSGLLGAAAKKMRDNQAWAT